MNSRQFVTLLLSVILALPAFAQQSNPSSGTQTAPPSQSADTTREPLQPSTPRDFWDGDDPNLLNLILHPFARKAWVKRQIQPIQDRVSELDQITAENAGKIKDVNTRAQQGLQLASEKTSLADQHVTEASNRAQTAQTAATQVSTRVSNAEQLVGNIDQYKGGAQTEIRFRPGQTVLSKSAKDALDAMAAPLKDQHSYIIEVRGFSSGSGQAAIAASQKMADSVVRYLVLTHNIPVYRIYVLSMGNAPATAEGTPAKRISGGKVEVDLLKNDLLSSAKR
jgi:outer membrane protein OmpA-like peptidoglycan-associated protein